MRIAVILMIQRDVKLCAMVHDGFLIEVPFNDLEHYAGVAEDCMREASRLVLYGHEVDVDREVHLDRFRDSGGVEMWNTICRLARIDDMEGGGNLNPLPAAI